MTRQEQEYRNAQETAKIEIRPRHVYFFAKFLPQIFLLITIMTLAFFIGNAYAKLSIAITAIVLLIVLILQYIDLMVCTSWTVTETKLIIRRGIVVRKTNETELFRIIDFSEKQNLIQQLVGNTDLYVYSADKTDPVLCLCGIKRDTDMFEEIKRRVKAQRIANNIYETTINNYSK